jgi:hypothetical protein
MTSQYGHVIKKCPVIGHHSIVGRILCYLLFVNWESNCAQLGSVRKFLNNLSMSIQSKIGMLRIMKIN